MGKVYGNTRAIFGGKANVCKEENSCFSFKIRKFQKAEIHSATSLFITAKCLKENQYNKDKNQQFGTFIWAFTILKTNHT